MKKAFKFFPQIFLIVVWFIFSHPYFLRGLVPFPSKYLINFFSPWNNYLNFPGPVKNNAMPDLITQIYPWKNLVISAWSNFQIPLWNPFSFSGTHLLANYQSAVFSPFNILFFIFPFIDAWSIMVLLQPLLAGFFMYLFLRTLSASKIASLISAVSFMFCGFITSWMGYASLGYAILFLPLSLYAIEKFFLTARKIYLLILAISIPLSFFSGHFQISIYFFLFVILFLFYRMFSSREIRKGIFCLLFVVFGFLLTAPQLLLSIDAYFNSFRSGIFQKTEVIPWQYLATFFAPDYFGNPVTRNDWFGHYAEWNAYLGIAPLILAVYAFLNIKRSKTLFFLLTGIFSLLLAFNTPVIDLVVALKIPVLGTSAAGRIIVLFSFSFAVLAGFGFDNLYEDIKKGKKKNIYILLSVFLIIFFALWMIVFLKPNLSLEQAMIARNNLLLPSAIFFWTFCFIFAAAFFRKKSILIIILFLVVFDMLRFATKWQSFDPKNLVFPETPVISKLQEMQENGRVIGGFGGAEISNYYGLPSVEGYDAVYMRRYGQFIASLKSGELSDSSRSVVSFPNDSLYASKAANLLGIEYVAHKIADGHNPWVFPFWNYPDQFKSVYKDEKYEIYQNTEVFPRAFLVNNYSVESNPQRILDTMLNNEFDLRKEVVLETDPGDFKGKSIGQADIVKNEFNSFTVNTNSDAKNILFIANSFSDGWKVKVDGVEDKIHRANFTFQAVALEKGKHKVELIYDPMLLKIGWVMVIIGGLGIVVVISRIQFSKSEH